MDEIIRRKEDDIVRKPYKEVVELLDEQPFTELLKDDRGGEYQLEIQLTWDDKSKGVIRVAAFLSGGSGRNGGIHFSVDLNMSDLLRPKIIERDRRRTSMSGNNSGCRFIILKSRGTNGELILKKCIHIYSLQNVCTYCK